jgi:hypothetical protein
MTVTASAKRAIFEIFLVKSQSVIIDSAILTSFSTREKWVVKMKYALDCFQPKLPQFSHTARERKKGWPDFGMRWALLTTTAMYCSWIATATRAFNSGCPSGNVYPLPYAKV